jgi:hypothetical protein
MKGEKQQMKVNLLSSFAAGVLLTTTICSAVYYSSNHNSSKNAVKVQLTETEMKDKLVAAGYVVVDKKVKPETKKTATTKTTESKPVETKPAETKPAVTQVTVNVSPGMTSIDVGQVLANAKLISVTPFQFSKEIEKRQMEKLLKPGSFTVNSDMSYDEIIDTIFKP